MHTDSHSPASLLRRRLLQAGLGTAVLSGAATLTACASRSRLPQPLVQPLGQISFEAYAAETRAWIASRRQWATNDHEKELAANAPSEAAPDPAQATGGGILCIHGLGDSPWSFTDQIAERSRAGWLARTVLLPGCGTRPEDMIAPDADDWRRVVREQAAILRRDLEKRYPGKPHPLWLAGFSTGCNLAVEAALEGDTPVDGLLLFSPALIVRTNLSFLAPLLSPFVTWLRDPQSSRSGGITAFRYTTVPVPGLAAFVDTMTAGVRTLSYQRFEKPAVVMLSEHDSVLETADLIEWLPQRMTSPEARFIWYGSKSSLGDAASDPRVLVYSDQIPEERITSFSHMALTYSPDNPEYGRSGKSRVCSAKGEAPSAEACLAGPPHYGAWGDPRRGSPSARLTFNPYFSEQQVTIENVMRASL